MSELVLTSAEQALLRALHDLGVPFLLVGMGAALVEGAQGTTQDLDIWLGALDPERLREAARRAGGFYTSGFGLQPPALGGEGLTLRPYRRTTAHGPKTTAHLPSTTARGM